MNNNQKRKNISIFSIASIIVSVTALFFYLIMISIMFSAPKVTYSILYYVWLILSIVSIPMPICSKLIRKNKRGKKLEIVSIVFVGFNFYYLIYFLTDLPMIIGFLGWIIYPIIYTYIEKKITQKIILSILALLAAVLVTFATIGTVKYIKNNVGTTVISFENKTALSGDTVHLSFEIAKNHGIWGGQIKINYDATAISFVSCANGNVFDECEVNNDDGSVNLLLNQSELKSSDINGIIATLNFKIKENAKKGDYKIEFDKSTNFCDENAEIIEPILEGGVITVK